MKKIIEIWYDSNGKKQYKYNPEYTKIQSQNKFDKIMKHHRLFTQIVKDIHKNLKSKDFKIKQIAMILYIMIHCGFRIGNKFYEKNYNSYGISTMKAKHAFLVKPGTIKFDFIGKKGIRNVDICKNNTIYKYISNTVAHKGKNDYIFNDISSSDVNSYLRQYGDISSKDLRTWMANVLFLKYYKDNCHVNKKNIIKHSIEFVSKKLHNTVSICKKSYIDNKLIQYITQKIKNDDIKL